MQGSTTRRTFLKAGATTLAAAAAGPMVITPARGAADKPIVGGGAYKYECVHDWGANSLPASASYGNASHGVALDKAGRIYITHNQGAPGSVFVFDPEGKFIKSLGGFHVAGGRSRGHGIDIREENGQEFLYLAASDVNMGWVKCDLNGQVVWTKGKADIHKDSGKYGKGVRYRPTNTSFTPDGGYVLGDGYGSNLLHQYNAKDEYVRSIGGGGTADGKFRTPHGQWLDTRDGKAKIVVADRANKRLQWFDTDGKHLHTLGGFLFPADIDTQGDLMLVPDLHCRITILDRSNKVVAQLGEDAEWRKQALAGFKMRGQRPKWRPARFIHPHDAAFDKDGNIYCAEWVSTGRVTKLRRVD